MLSGQRQTQVEVVIWRHSRADAMILPFVLPKLVVITNQVGPIGV